MSIQFFHSLTLNYKCCEQQLIKFNTVSSAFHAYAMLTYTNKVTIFHGAVSVQECTTVPKYFNEEQNVEFKLTVLEVQG